MSPLDSMQFSSAWIAAAVPDRQHVRSSTWIAKGPSGLLTDWWRWVQGHSDGAHTSNHVASRPAFRNNSTSAVADERSAVKDGSRAAKGWHARLARRAARSSARTLTRSPDSARRHGVHLGVDELGGLRSLNLLRHFASKANRHRLDGAFDAA